MTLMHTMVLMFMHNQKEIDQILVVDYVSINWSEGVDNVYFYFIRGRLQLIEDATNYYRYCVRQTL
jgi:hypothetical protein